MWNDGKHKRIETADFLPGDEGRTLVQLVPSSGTRVAKMTEEA